MGTSPASFFLVLGESRKTARNEGSHAAATTKCSPGERVRNGGPRRTLFLLSATPPEILGLPGKPHVTARTLPWTSAARVRSCRADECHRIFGSVFGLRNARDHHFSVHFFWYDSRKTREQGNTEFDCCLQGFFFFNYNQYQRDCPAFVYIFFVNTDFVGFRGVSDVGSGGRRFDKQASAYSTQKALS